MELLISPEDGHILKDIWIHSSGSISHIYEITLNWMGIVGVGAHRVEDINTTKL